MENLDPQKYLDLVIELAIGYGPRVILALLTLIIGFWLVKLLIRGIDKALRVQKIDPSLRGFLESLIATTLKILILIPVASMVGVQMTSFIAIIGAAGLAVGLALQGSLSNFAGGVLILFFKPFKVGDLLEAQGYTGKVKKILIFNTIIETLDGKTVIIPNGELSNGTIMNYNGTPNLRVDMTFGIGYGDDITKAKKVLMKLIEKDKRVLPEPATQVLVSELADSSVNLQIRAWVKNKDYWGLYFDMQEQVKMAFDKSGISIPYPQQDVHMYTMKK